MFCLVNNIWRHDSPNCISCIHNACSRFGAIHNVVFGTTLEDTFWFSWLISQISFIIINDVNKISFKFLTHFSISLKLKLFITQFFNTHCSPWLFYVFVFHSQNFFVIAWMIWTTLFQENFLITLEHSNPVCQVRIFANITHPFHLWANPFH